MVKKDPGKPCICCTGRDKEAKLYNSPQITQLSPTVRSSSSLTKHTGFTKTQSLTANRSSIIVFKAFSSWHKWSLICSKLCFNIRHQPGCILKLAIDGLAGAGKKFKVTYSTVVEDVYIWSWWPLPAVRKDGIDRSCIKTCPFFFTTRKVTMIYHLCDGKKRKGWRKENLLHLKFSEPQGNTAGKWEITLQSILASHSANAVHEACETRCHHIS